MKKLLTVSILALFATTASAQVYSNGVRAMGSNNNIIYNVSPLPPVMRGDQIVYPSGTAAVNTAGQATACNGPLTLDRSSGTAKVTCNTPGVQSAPQANAADLAATLSNLAPAAGGPTGPRSDHHLGSDAQGLRNDRDSLR